MPSKISEGNVINIESNQCSDFLYKNLQKRNSPGIKINQYQLELSSFKRYFELLKYAVLFSAALLNRFN